MAYTPPAYNAVNFALEGGYTPPAYNAVNFALGDVIAGESITFSLYPATASLVATFVAAPDIVVTLPSITGSLAATFVAAPDIVATIPSVTGSLAAHFGWIGSITATLPAATGSLTASQSATSVISAPLPVVTASLGATNTHLPIHADVSASLQPVTTAIHGIFQPKADIATIAPAVTASFSASNTHLPISADIDITLPTVLGSLGVHNHGSVSASLPKARANIATTIPRVVSGWSRLFAYDRTKVTGNYNEQYLVPLTGARMPVLSTISFRSGKHYAEVLANYTTGVVNTTLFIGVGRRDCVLALNVYPGSSSKSWGMSGVGAKYHEDVATSGGPDVSTTFAPVVFHVALDNTNGRLWIGANGTWWGSGNPSTDTNPTFIDNDLVDYPVHIMASFVAAGNRILTIRELTSQFTYSVPTGFTAWGQDSPAGWDDDIRVIPMRVAISGGPTRYDLPVSIHLDKDCGELTHYDGTHMIKDLDRLVRRFAVLDKNLDLCETILQRVVSFVDPVRYSIPERTTTYTRTLYNPSYLPDTAHPSRDGISNAYWYTPVASNITGQVKVSFDLGSVVTINRLTITNMAHNGTDAGIRDISVYGTNTFSAFDNTTYSDLTDLVHIVDLTISKNFQNDSLLLVDYPFDNTAGAFRYFVIQLHDNYTNTQYIGFEKIRFYYDAPEEMDFVTVLHEVSGTIEEEFFICWDTAKYESDTLTRVDYTYPTPASAETNIIFPPGLNPSARIDCDLPLAEGTLIAGVGTGSFLVGRTPKVRATASARSGNHVKAVSTHVTATGISATSVLFYEEVNASISSDAPKVEASARAGNSIDGECNRVVASMSASTKNRASMSASLSPMSASIKTGAAINSNMEKPTATMRAAVGQSCLIVSSINSVTGASEAHHLAIRRGAIAASLSPVIATAGVTVSKPNSINASAPSIGCSIASSCSHVARINFSIPRASVCMEASFGRTGRISGTIPKVDTMAMARTSENYRLLRYSRGETR